MIYDYGKVLIFELLYYKIYLVILCIDIELIKKGDCLESK